MDRYDIKKAHPELYAPSARTFGFVDVPPLSCIAVDGHGDPNTSSEYAAAVEALYAVAYTVKFTSKKALGRDLVVAPLEGLWRASDMSTFVTRDKGSWEWTAMIAQPDWIPADIVEQARRSAAARKDLSAISRVRWCTLTEGRSVQILHVGPYDDEAPTLARLHEEFMPAHGLTFNGDHHEVYLSDARRTLRRSCARSFANRCAPASRPAEVSAGRRAARRCRRRSGRRARGSS